MVELVEMLEMEELAAAVVMLMPLQLVAMQMEELVVLQQAALRQVEV